MPEEASIDESGELDTTLLSTNWKKYSPSSFDIYSAGVVLVQLALKPVRTQPAHDTYSSSSPAAEPRYVRLCKDDRLNPVLQTVGTVYECHHFNVRHIEWMGKCRRATVSCGMWSDAAMSFFVIVTID